MVSARSTEPGARRRQVAVVTAAPTRAPERALGVLLFTVAAVLLTSVGGLGNVAAPVTLPLMVLVVLRHPSQGFRMAGALIGGLTAASLTWGLVYIAAGEPRVVIWMLPLACGLATALGFARLGGAARHSRSGG